METDDEGGMFATGEWRAETRTAEKGLAFFRNATSRWMAGVREREIGAGRLELGRQTRTAGKGNPFAGNAFAGNEKGTNSMLSSLINYNSDQLSLASPKDPEEMKLLPTNLGLSQFHSTVASN
ncbi:Uncharacterized protein Fot_39635 [Forsythia ovata]|uniref:Uncharacterized protein n=1 Tax=Forsythia ovata TaxID=205694 RepID=A0ABD1S7P3_9LAMI